MTGEELYYMLVEEVALVAAASPRYEGQFPPYFARGMVAWPFVADCDRQIIEALAAKLGRLSELEAVA